MKIIGLYTAKLAHIGPKRNATGIYKQTVDQVSINELGIVGDIQVDKRFHGGPEKALHQFSLSSYEKIIKRYPLLHKQAKPGNIGENLSATHMSEHSVCIGDIYQVGSTILQVSSPRIPCWKIDAKFNQPDLSQFISQNRLSGWYYRVLQGGEIQLSEQLSLQERINSAVTVETMLKVINKSAEQDQIELAINAVGLDPEWQQRLKTAYQT